MCILLFVGHVRPDWLVIVEYLHVLGTRIGPPEHDPPRTRIERIAREEKPVTADTALRLGKFFKTGAAFWMNMQARFDLETAEDVLAPQIKKIASYEGA
jgi:hypothetical protein